MFSPTLTSCNKAETKVCDSLSIYKQYSKDHQDSLQLNKANNNSLKFASHAIDVPIEETVARQEHLNYLKGGLVLKDSNDKIIHYLNITKNDLSTLAKYGVGGMRLYFSEKTENSKTFLSIIAVPVDNSDDNVIIDKVTLINTLDPCPDRCALNQRYEGDNPEGGKFYNSENDLNYDKYGKKLWYKPNIDPKKPWVDKDNIPQ